MTTEEDAARMTGRQALHFQIEKLTQAIRLLRRESLPLPALMLVYATIDGLAWLQRKNPQGDSTSEDFRTWVDLYFPPDWCGNTEVTSQTLWAARCALLHSQAAESRQTRAGEVPEIWYRWNDLALAPNVTPPRYHLFVDPRELIAALEHAISRFRTALEANPMLVAQVEEQAKKLWVDLLLFPEMRVNR